MTESDDHIPTFGPLADELPHLPANKRRDIAYAAHILFREFEEAQKGKLAEHRKSGRIVRLVLYGSYARRDWVMDHKGGYYSDYDLLVIVNSEDFTDHVDYWDKAEDWFLHSSMFGDPYKPPVHFIVHSYEDVNDQLSRGRPFFVDIIRDGITLYVANGFDLVEPRPLDVQAAREEARLHYANHFDDAVEFRLIAQTLMDRDKLRLSAFQLHQATEKLFHCLLLVRTLYSPQLHDLKKLRDRCEQVVPALAKVWPRDTRFARRCFARLRRAYVEARYSRHYEITVEELTWLIERVTFLERMVEIECADSIS